MLMNATVPRRLNLRIVPDFRTFFFPDRREVHYIGGADILPAPLEQEEVPRQYAAKRGRKAAQRDDGDLLVAYNNKVDIQAHLKENGYLEVDYHGKDELDP